LQYRDFVAWQREALSSESLRAQSRYWRQRLAELAPPVFPPPELSRPRRQRFRGDLVRVETPAAIRQAMTPFCRSADVTLFMALLAGFIALLHRYTGERDICVGSGF